jgi:FixJ family two-component response regulator
MKNLSVTSPTVYVVDDDVSIRESLSSLIRPKAWPSRSSRRRSNSCRSIA